MNRVPMGSSLSVMQLVRNNTPKQVITLPTNMTYELRAYNSNIELTLISWLGKLAINTRQPFFK